MKELKPSYAAIHEFFQAFSLHQALKNLGSSILMAQREKIWARRSPANLLYFYERLEGLLEAAFFLADDDELRTKSLLAEDKAVWLLTNYDDYCGWISSIPPWDYFPRHLSKKEYLDPWLVFKKIIKHNNISQWKEQLKDFLQHALSRNNMNDFISCSELLEVWILLHKLVEAAHLAELRAISEDRYTQPRIKRKELPNAQQKQSPDKENRHQTCFREFFSFFGEKGGKQELWEMLKRSLTNESDHTPALDRSNMIFLYEQLTELLNSAWVLYGQEQATIT